MNRKAALFISVILLTQVASYSFNQITPQIDWKEPLQGDSTWEVSGRNNTTGNNTTGNSAPVISNMTISPSNPVVGDTLYCSWNYFDQDNDADQTTYWWYANGTYLSNWSNSWLDTSSLQVGSQIYCAGDAYDGVNWGNTISSQNVTLGSNNTGGNNTTTSAENIRIDLYGYASLNQSSFQQVGNWASGTTIWGEFNSSNLIYNDSYSMTWALLSGWSTTQIISQGNASWTANFNTSYESVNFTLADGQYMFQVYLYGANGNYLDHDMSFMQVGTSSANNNTGGNNTGGNNSSNNTSGCGNDTTLTDLWASTDSSTWGTWTNAVYGYFNINCTIPGKSYTLEVTLTDSTGWSSYSFWNWTETNDHEYMSEAWSNLSAGSYCVNATLWDVTLVSASNYVDSDNPCFTLSTNNTGGNNTGGNNTGDNTGNNTGGNNTNVVEYSIFNMGPEDCVQSGDELHITIILYAGPNEDHTLDWQIVADNGVVTSWHSQDVTTSSNGSAIFVWSLDTTNLSNGDYSLQLYDPIDGSFSSGHIIYFDVGCTGCGYDSSFTNLDYQIWSENFGTIFSTWNESIDGTNSSSNSVNDDTPQIISGSNIGFWGQIECIELDQSYLLNYTVTNSANLFVMGGEEYFNNSVSTWYWFNQNNISTALLPAGEYCITVTLYVSPYGSSDIIVTYTDCVEIVALEDWDGCGSNLTYLEHMQTVSGNPFVQQNVVFLTTSNIWVNNFVDCLVIGENYTMETVVTSDGNPYLQFSDSFTVNQFSDITQWDWQTISDSQNDIATGNYCVDTTIYSTDSTYTQQIATVSSLTDCFAVVNATVDDWWGNQDNGTGNGSGTPNDPVLPDTNCSELNGTLSGLNLTNSWNITDCENGTGFWFNLTVNGTGVTWYDPIYAVGYDYEVISGPKFSSVVVPPGYGDDKYDIYLWDGTEYVLAESDLDALTEYWFTDDGGISTTPGDYDGISKFSIRGLEISEKLDPEDPDAFVTGLSFVQDPNEIGEVILSMNPITVSDEDDDGIIDEEDNCVNTVNTNQADSDGDGVGDACEESQDTSDIDDNDSDSDSGTNVTNIIAIFTVCLVFVVLFMRGGGNDGDDDHQESRKNYYPFDQ